MRLDAKAGFTAALAMLIFLLAGCQQESPNPAATLELPSGRDPDASVSGTVTYRERVALTPGAKLVVDLRDVSYADGPAPLIARQTVPNPGRVPIKFKVEYNRDDIDSRNTYSVQADIVESDGRLAFINDTAYNVVTRGNPDKVNMVLVLVQPPPDLLEQAGGADSDWRTWVEAPARITWGNLIPNEPEPFLRIGYYQSTLEGCARPGNEEMELDGNDVVARVTIMQPPSTPWAIPCGEEVVELDTVLPIPATLQPGQTYRVLVNGLETAAFSVPREGLRDTFIDESPIETTNVVPPSAGDPAYNLRVVSGLPRGSGCSQFNGYEIRRRDPETTNVIITHHEVADPRVACTADYPLVETIVPLGSNFESGIDYTITVNSETAKTFTAR